MPPRRVPRWLPQQQVPHSAGGALTPEPQQLGVTAQCSGHLAPQGAERFPCTHCGASGVRLSKLQEALPATPQQLWGLNEVHPGSSLLAAATRLARVIGGHRVPGADSGLAGCPLAR